MNQINMSVTANLMTTAIDDCCDLIQALTEYCRFGAEDWIEDTDIIFDNAEDAITSFYSLQAIIEMLQERGAIPRVDKIGQENIKRVRIEQINKDIVKSEKRGFIK